MPRKKAEPSAKKSAQFNVRADAGLMRRLEDTATGLGLDLSSFVRMLLVENLPVYEERVFHLRQKRAGKH